MIGRFMDWFFGTGAAERPTNIAAFVVVVAAIFTLLLILVGVSDPVLLTGVYGIGIFALGFFFGRC